VGLDMYLNRYVRHGGTIPAEINAIESYLSWLDKKNKEGERFNNSFAEWCGEDVADRLPDQETIGFYKQFRSGGENDWYRPIGEEVAYWRKANAIHGWFVENVQGGVDDCDYHREVTKKDLENLRDTCLKVLTESILINGIVKNGKVLENGEWHDILEPGKVIINTEVAEELLPVQEGFFFGGTEYDEYYVEDLKNTVKAINDILETTDFTTQMIYYQSSW